MSQGDRRGLGAGGDWCGCAWGGRYKKVGDKRHEPIEEVVIEVDDAYAGAVIEGISLRRGELQELIPNVGNSGRSRLQFTCPSRGLLGFRTVLSTSSHGSALMHRSFLDYEPYRGPVDAVRKGALVSMAAGTITAHALMTLEARGTLFVAPGQEVQVALGGGGAGKVVDEEGGADVRWARDWGERS